VIARASLLVLLAGCLTRLPPAPAAVKGGVLVIEADVDEVVTQGGLVVKRERRELVYRHAIESVQDGIVVHAPQVAVLRWVQRDREASAAERDKLASMLAVASPGFRVATDGSWRGLVEGSGGGLVAPDVLEAAARDRWRLVSEGWDAVQRVGQVDIEDVHEEVGLGQPVPMQIRRSIVSHGPCVQEPRRQCRVRLLRTEARIDPLGEGVGEGVLEARIADAPDSPWPMEVVSERWFEVRSRAGEVSYRKDVTRRERWRWE